MEEMVLEIDSVIQIVRSQINDRDQLPRKPTTVRDMCYPI